MSRRFKAGFNKRPVKNEVWPCDSIREGDGVDPRFEYTRNQVANRKAMQLASQVQAVLNITLGRCGNGLLRELYVESVIPAPDSSQLLVTLFLPEDVALSEASFAIEGAAGMLRSEVGSYINRKRVPQLKFVFTS